MKHALIAIVPLVAWCQKPVISPGGVVNAASYAQTLGSGGSIVSIFGTNLAASVQTAKAVPLPRQLGGTSVTVSGTAAPLFYVSPTQINFQMPSPGDTTPGVGTASGIVVSTAAGSSDPYNTTAGWDAVGIFTMDSSGCGRGAVLNVGASGALSLNSPENSASPGDWISVYGTGIGLVYNSPPDGVPAPFAPLTRAAGGADAAFDFVEAIQGIESWDGRAPGFVGLDQFNVQIPLTARQGCAVPLQIISYDNDPTISQPVTIAIRQGRGPCVDPPVAGYGQITWEKTVMTTDQHVVTETDIMTLSLQTSPGKLAPTAPVYTEGPLPGSDTFFGTSCPIPGYRSLAAGTVTVQGPGLGATLAAVVPLQGAGPSGLSVYQATLPSGTIQAGAFTVTAGGGADVGAFQASIQIGSEINIITALAGLVVFYNCQPLTINWTGGDPNAWVTAKLVLHERSFDGYNFPYRVRASEGTLTIQPPPFCVPLPGGGVVPLDIVVEVEPDPSQTPTFSAPGLPLGGRVMWRYTYHFEATQAG